LRERDACDPRSIRRRADHQEQRDDSKDGHTGTLASSTKSHVTEHP